MSPHISKIYPATIPFATCKIAFLVGSNTTVNSPILWHGDGRTKDLRQSKHLLSLGVDPDNEIQVSVSPYLHSRLCRPHYSNSDGLIVHRTSTVYTSSKEGLKAVTETIEVSEALLRDCLFNI